VNQKSFALIRAPRSVVGYYGCQLAVAHSLLGGASVFPSQNAYDWLGSGVYFWEYAPFRALDWAEAKCAQYGGHPAVLVATLRLGSCLNLLDTEYAVELGLTYEVIASQIDPTFLLKNTRSGAHFLDNSVIETHCRLTVERGFRKYDSVRGCFPEGSPIYAGSKIVDKAHVQIAVRNPTCISNLRLVELD
jgi:hypothetical protein